MCEAVINGRYYWVPFARLSRIDIEAPADLRDVVWMPAHLQFTNGGDAVGVIPDALSGIGSLGRLRGSGCARQTEWRGRGPDVFHGLGQRLLDDRRRRARADGRPVDPVRRGGGRRGG